MPTCRHHLCGSQLFFQTPHCCPLQVNELYHWKYIKRTGSKGNYRYYYKNDGASSSKSKEKRTVKEAVRDALGYDEMRDKTVAAVKNAAAKSEYESAVNRYERAKNSGIDDSIVASYRDTVDKAAAKHKAAAINFVKAEVAYSKTPLGKIETITKNKTPLFDKTTTIKSGNTVVYSKTEQGKISKTIDKGKEKVAKIITKVTTKKRQKETEKKNIRRDRS